MATITVNGNNMSSFDVATEHVGEAVMGTTYDGNYNHKVVCRYRFTTDGYGATKISFKTANATATVRGSSSSEDSIGRMRFAFGTGASTYVGYQGNKGYAITDYSYGKYVSGSLTYNFLPNTTYYLWIFAASNFSSYTRFSLGSCTLTTSGSYGTASSISASNGTFGSDIPVTLTNSVSGTTNTLTVSCGGITKTLLDNSSSMSATWTPSLSEYGAAITNAKSATATFTVTTKYGSATWGTSTKTITVSFPSSAGPSISATSITYDNSASAALSAFTVFVQGYSKAKATITAAGQYNATISTYALTINGATVSGSSNIQTSTAVTTSGTVTATIQVTDSRGFTASTTQTFVVEPYSNPVLESVQVLRCKQDGTQYVEDEGGVYLSVKVKGSVSSCGGENSVADLIIECNKAADNTSMFAPDTSADLTNDPQVADIFPGLDPDYTWIATVTITDALGNSTSSRQTLPTQKWALKFNATATAVGFGKAPEADKVLEIPADWKIKRDQLFAVFYPVGAIYMSVDSTNPGTLFGGTWERITGRFLLAATDDGANGGNGNASIKPGYTGGEATHELTVSEMPWHGHSIRFKNAWTATGTGSGNWLNNTAYIWGSNTEYCDIEGMVNYEGGNGAHNNMPPYLAVYVWKRTA